jgi:predicted component of viral defense system (DUF524 family)
MSKNKLEIPIVLNGEQLTVHLFDSLLSKTLDEVNDAEANGEAKFQIKEGCSYEFEITSGYRLFLPQVVYQLNRNPSAGYIRPNVFVGTLVIDVINSNNIKCGEFLLEVQSAKTTYREDYRIMLEEITDYCLNLILLHSTPITQNLIIDFESNSDSLYQRFAFIKSILNSLEFNDAVYKIISNPVTKWTENDTIINGLNVKRLNRSTIKQFANSINRLELPQSHQLKKLLHSIPSKITINNKKETIDTAENRFVKHALIYFQTLCQDVFKMAPIKSRLAHEASTLIDKFDSFLSHSLFKELSKLKYIPQNSPILQRKEGYREVFRVWLMLDLAAKMVWHGGDDVYKGNKRDVAKLYEYWLFFKLLEIVKEVFGIDSLPLDNLIEQTEDKLGLKIKQGQFLPIEGTYQLGTRKLRVQFSYNRRFKGNSDYPSSGSWTRSLIPDYTLSIWPFGIEQEQAEKEELIVHIHFDAKYKIENLQNLFGESNDEEEEEQLGGTTYKKGDLLKMHTYKDAIRRTAGAYVLYPGTTDKYTRVGFHEIIPGLGAFSIRPSKTNDGSEDLKQFLKEILNHFMNRASEREKISLKTYLTYKDDFGSNVDDPLPETYGPNRSLIPDETFVLIGYYRKENWNWIISTKRYNARAEDNRGSLKISPEVAGAKYLLLHSSGELKNAHKLFKIKNVGPKVYSKETLESQGYLNAKHKYYLVYEIEQITEQELVDIQFDLTRLPDIQSGFQSTLPIAVSLTTLMQTKIK